MSSANKKMNTDRVKFELRATGIKPAEANPMRSGIHNRGYLPHVKREGARYFITFRLDDCLPKEVLLKYQGERAERLQRFYANHEADKKMGNAARTQDTLDEIEREYF